MKSDVILTVENLEKTYVSQSETLTVLKNLSFSVNKGSKTVIVGESGCGKSTLLNIIGSIDKATSGKITAGPWDVTNLLEDECSKYRASFIGLVFQFHYLLKDFTALENVYMSAYMQGESKKNAVKKAEQLLVDVGLKDRMNHLPSELSGGERQRVAVARALINSPSLILADEPTGNLDPENAVLISNLLFEMADKYEKTLILVTHDEKIAEKGSEIYKIIQGNLVRK